VRYGERGFARGFAMIPITTFAGRKVAVFGLARSGIVSAEALRAGGAEVACWDDGEAGRAAAAKAGLPLVDLKTADWSQFAALVLAPGVPLTHPKPHWTVERAKQAGAEIIGDIELFFRERAKVCPECPVIAITGTNGKSTTTALIAHVLRSAGKDVQMGGNIGVGVLALEPPAKDRYFVIEMSSFQIDLTPGLKPTVGVLLNITPDHLDRHGTMENYQAIKQRVPGTAQRGIIGIEDGVSKTYCDEVYYWLANEGGAAGFSTTEPRIVGVTYHKDARLMRNVSIGGGTSYEALVDLKSAPGLRGAHNLDNAAAAFLACEWLQIPHDEIGSGLKSFGGLAHRMEPLGFVGRATIINDSKGTNADSSEKALASFPGAIYWIAGGVPKEGGIESLVPLFGRVAKAFLVGQCAPDFARTLDGKVAYEMCGTLDVAIASAARDAALSTADEPVILLSPACASYDQYKSFEHRGDHFRALAEALPGFQKKRIA
jgi:UDP-N-acetylmuramoylalanine--D-glutamate ligase